ncbi:MAG TPA: hypothetical protein VKV02_13810 [Acidobacteriaceae bacterium]|nr:hypothetical protein [Acidobacteriaceae bacterium]
MSSQVPGENADASNSTTGMPLELTHAQMNAAYDTGQAVPFAQAVPWLARYHNAWWVVYEGGWLRVIDQQTADSLDRRAAQMTGQDKKTARDASIRGALSSVQPQPPAGE